MLSLAFLQGAMAPNRALAECLARIEDVQPRLNPFITVTADAARDAERALRRRRGARTLLDGMPIAVKDLLFTREAPTTAGSRIFGDGLVTAGDADVVARVRRAGGLIVGKTNLHEVALGVTNVNEHFGPVRNPWNPAHVSGGSSGGSAVAVATGCCVAAIGTDTRGSIRIPASACGITGFKPTYGLLSVVGVLPLSYSLDHIGPMARSVTHAARLLAAMVQGAARQRALLAAPRGATRHLTVGICEYHVRDMDKAVGKAIDTALRELRPLVKNVRAVEIPELEGVHEASGVIASAEAVAFHDAYLRDYPEGYGPIVRGRLEGGYRRSALEYVQAIQKQALVKEAFADTFQTVDLLMGAVLPHVPGLIASPQEVMINGESVNTVDASTRFNAPANVAGIPALSVPCGFAGGLPTGLQIMGPEGGDARVLSLGGAWQRATDWHERRPPRFR